MKKFLQEQELIHCLAQLRHVIMIMTEVYGQTTKRLVVAELQKEPWPQIDSATYPL